MQDIMEELLKESSFLDPYLKQFLKYLLGKEVLTIGIKKEYLISKINNLGYNVQNQEVIEIKKDKTYDGIIIFNTLNEIDKVNILQLFGDIYSILTDNGYLFIVNRLNEEENNYPKEFLDVILRTNFNFIEELSSYDNLKFYIYAKNTIK